MTAVAPRDVDVRNLQFAPGNDRVEYRAAYPASMNVCVRFGGRDRRRSAIDVSEEGMFIESPDHLAPGELVQVLVSMPDDRTLRALATVERVVTPDEAAFCGGMPGMGLRFFMMDARLQERWRAYLEQVAAGTLPKSPDPSATEHRVDPEEPSRRGQPRKPAAFRVRIADEAGLRSFYTRNVSRGGMFLSTADLKPLGTLLNLVVRHPVSGRQYPLEAEVRWTRASGPVEEHGMGVQLTGGEREIERSFLRFINEG